MHESGQVQALLHEALARTPGSSRLRTLRILVGEACGHSPPHLAEHFSQAAKGTRAQGAVLEFALEKLAAQCARCKAPFDSGQLSFACPNCGNTDLVITAGNTVRLLEVEAD
jgi:hydrogenase nickel incorporation protein HypA/HybF